MAGAPFRQGQDFAKGLQGQRLELSERVLNMAICKPVQGAVLDLWQTNPSGDYDYKGFNLRGKIVTDKDGKYVLDTIYPARLHGEGNITPEFPWVIEYYIFDLNQIIKSFMLR